MKNTRVRFAMLEAKITQKELAKACGTTQPQFSAVLGMFELAKKEQDKLIATIKELKAAKEKQ